MSLAKETRARLILDTCSILWNVMPVDDTQAVGNWLRLLKVLDQSDQRSASSFFCPFPSTEGYKWY